MRLSIDKDGEERKKKHAFNTHKFSVPQIQPARLCALDVGKHLSPHRALAAQQLFSVLFMPYKTNDGIAY
jgi:hypothetical protein